MYPSRSYLFIPGSKPDWTEKGLRSGADAVVFDLEDAVAPERKDEAREHVVTSLGIAGGSVRTIRLVRVNGWRTGRTVEDLDAVIAGRPHGICLSKTDGPDDILRLAEHLDRLEAQHGLARGSVEIVPLPETPGGIRAVYEICVASRRVRRLAALAGASCFSDASQALGLDRVTSRIGTYLAASRTNIDARAAGVTQLIAAPPLTTSAARLVRRSACMAKLVGCTGSFAIHPEQVPHLNEVFAPSASDVEFAIGVLRSIANSLAHGDGATSLAGSMVDSTHARAALQTMRACEYYGIPIPSYPHVEIEE